MSSDMSLNIVNNLTPTQSGLRDYDLLTHLIDHVQKGGFFTGFQGKPLIQLVKFEDDQIYIRDGHHRIAALYVANRQNLREDEYQITKMRYNQFEEINFESGWVTPFDPRIEVRKPDFFTFKKAVMSLKELGQDDLLNEMLTYRRHLYRISRFATSKLRKYDHIRDLLL